VYPPAAQYALALGAWLSPHPIGMKLVFGLCDLLTFAVLWRWLRALGLPPQRAIIHGYCPLLAVEFAGQGHTDSLAVLFMAIALVASARGRHAVAAAALAVATAGKLLPAVLLPFLLRRMVRPWAGAAVFALVLALLYARFAAPPKALLSGTLEYGMRWRSNDSLFALIHAATAGVAELFGLAALGVMGEPQRLAKVPLVVLGLGVLAWCYARRLPPARAGFWFFATFLAIAPVVHPWYVALLVPFLCLEPRLGLLAFTGTVFLAYHVLPRWHTEQVWHELWWVKVLEYAPPYAGLIAALIRPLPPRLSSSLAAAGDRSCAGSS
jgi:uncharacterized membrane protein